ncbi:MAG: DUF3313 domain-containing protein [Desulfobacterales bacterium]|jgi:hypothetical protein|nr:MAG: DUF3313 domain-containing protein [Desulfobacterales bacterium]
MDKIVRIYIFILVGFLSLALVGCAGPQAAKTGFLKDYSKLQPHPEIEGRHRYINPNIDASKYNKFIVDPVAINLSKEGKEKDIDPEDMEKLARYFRKQIAVELKKDYQIVNKTGPDVMRIRTSISEIDKTNPLLNIHPGTKLTGVGLGGAGAEMELVDSVTGERIAAAIDNQKGSRLDITGGLTWYGNAESVMDNWAEDLKKWVDAVHGKTSK